MRNPGVALQTLAALHRVGVQLAIDDYGTGYASLAYLQKMPIQQLKIDRTFVMDMHLRRQDATIVRSTIDLAHGLGLRVVAEGVESVEHERLLASMGCDAAQGFGIARPMNPAAFEAWCAARRPPGGGAPLRYPLAQIVQ
jgi:EAL domain-containing protein (putative c-di-GMP-specific phosphodiesterase class I)